jgi:putative acetyltransferase
VRPERQGRGIGSALIRRGLELCRERGRSIVVVVGDPAYYRRFGFSPEAARNLRAPFSGEAFMAMELVPGSLTGVVGTVKYPDAFGLVE